MTLFQRIFYRRRLTPSELRDYQTLYQMENGYSFLARIVSKNTLLVPSGQEEVRKFEALAQLISQEKQNYLAACFKARGLTGSFEATVSAVDGRIRNIRPVPAPVASGPASSPNRHERRAADAKERQA